MAQRSRKASSPKGGSDKPVEVRSKLRNRFYETIILLWCLRSVYAKMGNKPAPPEESVPNSNQSAVDRFRTFVNKLGQLCDYEKGGKTVTAFAVLTLESGKICYVFACNNQLEAALDRTRRYISGILEDIGAFFKDPKQKSESESFASSILKRVLVSVKPRARSYGKALHQASDDCIAACEAEDTAEAKDMQTEIRHLKQLSAFAEKKDSEEEQCESTTPSSSSPVCLTPANAADKVAVNCEILIREIEKIYQSPLKGFSSKARHENSCWSELRHAMGRLVSYYYAVSTLVATCRHSPELFIDFEMKSIPSTARIPNPFPKGRPRLDADGKPVGKQDHSAAGIIGRMTSDADIMQEFQDKAQLLQGHGLDEMIKEEVESENLRPFAHAEVIVDGWLASNGHTHPSHFFNEDRYIGCSKPTCLLCEVYFKVHPKGFKVRPGHPNLYPSWRTPDVYQGQDAAVREREKTMISMLDSIRKDTFRALDDKVSQRKNKDSNTNPTMPHDFSTVSEAKHDDESGSTNGDETSSTGRLSISIEDLAERLAQVGIRPGREGDSDSSDDEQGGVLV